MAKPIKSAIQHMARLERALLAAEARLKAMNAKAQIGLTRMRAEIDALTLEAKPKGTKH